MSICLSQRLFGMLCLWRFSKLSVFSSFVAVLASKRVTPKRPILHCAFDHRTTSCQKQNQMQIHVVTFLPIFLCAQTPVVTRSAWRQCFSFTRQATKWTSRSLEAQWSRMQSTVETSYRNHETMRTQEAGDSENQGPEKWHLDEGHQGFGQVSFERLQQSEKYNLTLSLSLNAYAYIYIYHSCPSKFGYTITSIHIIYTLHSSWSF